MSNCAVTAGDYVVRASRLIETREEARQYYQQRLVGRHKIQCHGKQITVVFEAAATHLYSVEIRQGMPDDSLLVRRRLTPHKTEFRCFDLERARLMDEAIRAIECFTVSVPGTGSRGHENRMLHGPRLQTGEYLRVVLRPGRDGAWTCVSAYPVEERVWRAMHAAKRAKFPP